MAGFMRKDCSVKGLVIPAKAGIQAFSITGSQRTLG